MTDSTSHVLHLCIYVIGRPISTHHLIMFKMDIECINFISEQNSVFKSFPKCIANGCSRLRKNWLKNFVLCYIWKFELVAAILNVFGLDWELFWFHRICKSITCLAGFIDSGLSNFSHSFWESFCTLRSAHATHKAKYCPALSYSNRWTSSSRCIFRCNGWSDQGSWWQKRHLPDVHKGL